MEKWARISRIFLVFTTVMLSANHRVVYAASPITLQVSACPANIQIAVISTNAEQYASVTVETSNGQSLSVPLISSSFDGIAFIDNYQLPVNLGFDSTGIATVSYADGSTVSTTFVTDDCGLPYSRMSSLRGSIFNDLNSNGLRDANEPVTFSWFKISDGGSWHVCGYAGIDGTFGIPLKSGWYDAILVAPQGWRATTPKLRVYVGGPGHPALNVSLGLTRNATASLESCDQYHPIR